MNSNEGKQKFFVVYQITNLLDNRIYVGAHVTYNVNDKYMGSSKYLKKDIKEFGRQNFRKEILHVFDNKEDMMKKEAEIVDREFCHRIDTYNRMVGGIFNWSVLDMIPCKDLNENILLIYRDDPRYLSGELVHMNTGISYNKGKFLVKDESGNVFKVDKNDERYLSGEVIPLRKGLPQHPNFSWLGKNHTEETKQKMSAKASEKRGEKNSQYGTCWITNGIENKKIKKELLEEYEEQGYSKGRIYKV